MESRLDLKSGLLPGPTAYAWFWTFVFFFVAVFVCSGISVLTFRGEPTTLSVVASIALATCFFLFIPLWVMIFAQNRREIRAGYTTLWAGEDVRQADEVDPSTGLIIRLAGNDPLTRAERRLARHEARTRASQLVASGAPYKLPFGWVKPRRRGGAV